MALAYYDEVFLSSALCRSARSGSPYELSPLLNMCPLVLRIDILMKDSYLAGFRCVKRDVLIEVATVGCRLGGSALLVAVDISRVRFQQQKLLTVVRCRTYMGPCLTATYAYLPCTTIKVTVLLPTLHLYSSPKVYIVNYHRSQPSDMRPFM